MCLYSMDVKPGNNPYTYLIHFVSYLQNTHSTIVSILFKFAIQSARLTSI